ncbi:ROK family protein [Paenibacillus glucanolyticus]|uniref:ROK family protein n=1 Tax=Paenibacillus TaxID=44249 RepID=UPI0003E2815C|nr:MULTISPECIES: ROK family protein [Paenibacillus]ANA79495.1 ROK family protein [Paenibacillus glucanolyticus]AVV56556.1 ROK family protein [Paenibacillus glucanolyticus]ETT31164.1 ROK family protein [Paenibacillus sp. FSL R5-808]
MTNITGDQALVKKINTSIILDTIRQHAPVSRAKVSKLTGLNKATVSNLVQELSSHHLIQEIGPGESSGGRKPQLLLFNGKAGYAIGVELRVKQMTAVLTDLEGRILAEDDRPLEGHDVESVTRLMVSMINGLMRQAPPSHYGIIGIGVGVPGMVDGDGTVLFAPNLGWDMVPLQKQLEHELGLPVTIDNEANAGAQGELRFGAGQDARHLLYISAGSGIGSGIIINGELYKGARGYAGESGHMSIEAEGRECTCGNRGCWELYASEKSYDSKGTALPSRRTSELIHYAEQGHEETIRHFEELGRFLGVGITNLVNGFNPQSVIIGGPLSDARPWIEETLQQVVAQRTLPYHRELMEIRFAELGSRSTLIGAAYSAISQFLGPVRVSMPIH